MDEQAISRFFKTSLTDQDYEASATSQSIEQIAPLISKLENQQTNVNTILELGVGYGGLADIFADILNCEVIYGIDVDDERLATAASRGISTHNLNLESDRYPFDDGEIDLVLAFGVFEHLRYYDHALEESNRILRDGGRILQSVPNLASWANRIALFFGNQPRDVEISTHRAFNISNMYSSHEFLDHVHSPTYSAFINLLKYHGFHIDEVASLFPYQNKAFVQVIDKATSYWPSLARRFAVLGTKA